MTFTDVIKARMLTILNEEWSVRESDSVPKTNDVALKNGAVRIEAAFLYADLAESTALQKKYRDTFSAKVIRMYLAGASSIIRDFEGHIKSFDGDRVMGVFSGKSKCNNAVLAAFAIQWLVIEVINPLIKHRCERSGTSIWQAEHGIGIDVGETFIARAGVRNSKDETTHNDLIFTNKPPNVAAKLSALRGNESGPITITDDVFKRLNDKQKHYLKKVDHQIWRGPEKTITGPYQIDVYKTDYWRTK